MSGPMCTGPARCAGLPSAEAGGGGWTKWTPLVVLLAVVAPALMGCQDDPNIYVQRIGDQTFRLDTAVTPQEKHRGLGGRTEIADDGGMIFIFDDDRERSFIMRDCLVDIDLIYLDRNGFIVSVHEMTVEEPRRPDESEVEYKNRLRRYFSNGRSRYVIELKAGKIRELGLSRGQNIDLDLKRLKALAESADGR